MVDFHAHLLSEDVKFTRIYDRLAITFFANKLGINPKELLKNPYQAYTKALIANIRGSKYIQKSVLFGVDARVDDRGKELHRDITVCATNEALLALYHDNPDIIIPFFSINPLRPDALELIDKYVELGFRGAKFLQNYWHVDTSDRRFIPYFEKLKEKNLPLIIHVGSESSIHSHKPSESLEMVKSPLAVGVKVVAAHMALSYTPLGILKAFSQNPKHFNQEYHQLLEMLTYHDNLYADLSAMLTPVRAKALAHLAQEKSIHHKLLFGTDFPVPFSTRFNSYTIPWKERKRLSRIENPHKRYVEAMLYYFKEDSPIYTNYQKLLF